MSTSQADGGSSRPRRMLAAIMFTDVVGFSARMGANEVLTMQLVRRDLDFMQQQCGRRGGRVVKSTGDGLLVIFDSAVEAVRCALDIQTAMAEAGTRLGAKQALEHRIAVHLGDIIQTHDDVIGDGVNVAARLQPLAEPGGVCISGPTYDVIKNRLPFEAASVGPCELKNIAEPIAVYKVSPMSVKTASAGSAAPATEADGDEGRGSRRRWMWRAGVGAAVIVVIALLAFSWMDSASARRVSPAAPLSKSDVAPATATAPDEPDAAPVVEDAGYMEVRESFVKRYDFAGLAAHLLTHEELVSDRGNRRKLIERYQSLDGMMHTMRRDLRAYSSGGSLRLPAAGTQAAWEVWMDTDNRLHIREAGQVRQVELTDVGPQQMIRLLARTLIEWRPGKKKMSGKAVGEQVRKFASEFGVSRAAADAYLRDIRAAE